MLQQALIVLALLCTITTANTIFTSPDSSALSTENVTEVFITTLEPNNTEDSSSDAITEEPTTIDQETTETPSTEAPTTETPTTEAPTTEAPTTEAPTTELVTTPLPDLPTVENVILSNATKDGFNINWDYNDIAGLTGFTINCRCVSLKGKEDEDCPEDISTYLDADKREASCNGTASGALYTACVQANGDQGNTNCTVADDTIVTVPNSPDDVQLMDNTENSFTIDITPPSNGGFVSFRVEVEGHKVIDSNETMVTIDQLSSSTRYPVSVYTVVNYEEKEENSTIPTMLTVWTVPLSVEDLTVNSSAYSSLVNWNPPNGSDGVDTYVVNVKNESGECVQSLEIKLDGSKVTAIGNCSELKATENLGNETNIAINITGLDPCTDYMVEVIPVNPGGNGTGLSKEMATDIIEPKPVENLNVVNITAFDVTLSWNVLGCDRSDAIERYYITYTYTDPLKPEAEGEDLEKIYITSDSTIQEYVIKDLKPYKVYTFGVIANNREGNSSDKATVIDQTLEAAPSSKVEIVKTSTTADTIVITWQPPTEPNGVILKYEVELTFINQTSEEQDTIKKEVSGENNKTEISDLYAYWDYTITVEAFNSMGNGSSRSDETIVKTNESTPGKVNDIIVEPIDDVCNQLKVKWREPEVADRNGVIDSYRIVTKGNGVNYNQSCSTDKDSTDPCFEGDDVFMYDVKELDPNNGTYNFQVFAVTIGIGDGPDVPITKSTGLCAPTKPEDGGLNAATNYEISDIDKTKQFGVQVDKTFIGNDTNGNIILKGILVADVDLAGDDNLESFTSVIELNKKYVTWKESKNNGDGKLAPYRATPDDWQSADKTPHKRTKREDEDYVIEVIGSDDNCDDNKDNKEYCNGPLYDERHYKVKVVTCTKGGCTVTMYTKGDYTTVKVNFPFAAVVVPLLIVLILVPLIVLFLMYRKGNMPAIFKRNKSSNHRPQNSGTQLSNLTDTDTDVEPKSRPVLIKNFGNHVEELHRDTNYLFAEEYETLKDISPVLAFDNAEAAVNRTKNRYINILPWDNTRVKLLPSEDEDGSDYINANYMPGYANKREYIATQGPLDHNLNDFWRMMWEQNVFIVIMVTNLFEKGRVKQGNNPDIGYNINREFIAAQGPLPCTIDVYWRLIWEQRVPIIVMLTNVKERERSKCAKYWPDDQDPVFYGDIRVLLRSESVLGDYVIRVMDISHGDNKRTVKQIHYIKWPDFGCPENTGELLNLVQVVRNEIRPDFNGPICIHCSAGVGRTGTFICVDRLLQHMRDHDEIDVFGTVLEMRHYRCHMVQTEDQYIYIHDCLKDAIDRGLNLGPVNNVYENFGLTENTGDEPLYANASVPSNEESTDDNPV